jgi:tetratricopeptide (TPR) repeat protein
LLPTFAWFYGAPFMNKLSHSVRSIDEELSIAPAADAPITLPALLGRETTNVLQRMFRDPRVLQPEERRDLVMQLKNAVELAPNVAEIRVVYGMALCVDLQAQEAMEQMREAVRQAPDSFIARLKFGELLMRLRICDQAAEHTQKAAELATNDVQSDLARRQATTIRTMRREGIERGGFSGLRSRLIPRSRKSRRQENQPVLAATK